jgi:predicted AAA+ superfamily ATPase
MAGSSATLGGGDSVPITLQGRVQSLFGVTMREAYGITEAVRLTINRRDSNRLARLRCANGPVRRFPNAKYMISSYILHMWIPRAIELRLERSARTRPVIVLTGARQTGKTSTFLRLFPKHSFVSLDLPTEAEQAEKEPRSFLQRHPPPVIIDEAQYAPALFRHLKVEVDAHRTRNGQFLLTGSQKFTMMKNVSESLAGRADIVELETLSYAEILSASPGAEVEAVIVRGGFPELYANPDIDLAAFYNSYLATYLERDVRTLSNVGSLRDFERFLRACALRSANLLNKADLARDVGISPSTANQWLSMLVASGQAVMLEPWFSNRTKSIVKSPKLYLADTGLLCALLNIRSGEDLRQSPFAGAVWETFVFAQLRARERNLGRTGNLFFWRDRTREVDFVVDAGGLLQLFEAKWTELPGVGDTVNLEFVRTVMGDARVTGGSVVARTPFQNGFRAVPVRELG